MERLCLQGLESESIDSTSLQPGGHSFQHSNLICHVFYLTALKLVCLRSLFSETNSFWDNWVILSCVFF